MHSIDEQLKSIRQQLPPQNPMWAFVHNNLLMGYEQKPFFEALEEASRYYTAKPVESETYYQNAFRRGRIHAGVLEQVLNDQHTHVTLQSFLESDVLSESHVLGPLTLGQTLERCYRIPYTQYVLGILFPLISSHLDQGMAAWTHGFVEQGIWAHAQAYCGGFSNLSQPWERAWVKRMKQYANSCTKKIIEQELAIAGSWFDGDKAILENYLKLICFELRGWSGLVTRLEDSSALAPVSCPRVSLASWAALMLVTSHAVVCSMMDTLNLNPKTLVLQARAHGAKSISKRSKIWQEAFEASFEVAMHGCMNVSQGIPKEIKETTMANTSVVLCIDDREESFARAIESIGTPTESIRVWNTPGFFGLEMMFQGIHAARPTQQCPPVIDPKHVVHEVSVHAGYEQHHKLNSVYARMGSLHLSAYYASRALLGGWLVSFLLGLFALFPLLFKILLNTKSMSVRKFLLRSMVRKPETTIDYSSYSLDQRVQVVGDLLIAMGMKTCSPLVAIVAHAATSTNNPFRQAYGCGACSGNSGATNARVFCAMANEPEVRQGLEVRGIQIPSQTRFVPYVHDTTLDTVELLDKYKLDEQELKKAVSVETILNHAALLNAEERAKRFKNAPKSREGKREYAQSRAYDLAQPRPEYGHARVAACVVGPRSLTERVVLDRRSFLVSYDPKTDHDGSALERAVVGSVPVCVNIAMDYFYSRMDPEGFGAGSKLPLNIVSLLGVMTGGKNDVRIGLGRQMVELHEPMRVLVWMQAKSEHIHALLAKQARLKRLVEGGWMHLNRIDPITQEVESWDGKQFVSYRWKHIAHSPGLLAQCFDSIHDQLIQVEV